MIPGKNCHVRESYDTEEELNLDLPIINPPAFPDENIENKIHKMLEVRGVKIYRNAELIEI